MSPLRHGRPVHGGQSAGHATWILAFAIGIVVVCLLVAACFVWLSLGTPPTVNAK